MEIKWHLSDIENKTTAEMLDLLNRYETKLIESKEEKLEYKRQLNTLKYRIKKLCE